MFWGRGKGDTVLKARQDKPYHGRVPIEKKDAGFRRVAGASNFALPDVRVGPTRTQVRKATDNTIIPHERHERTRVSNARGQ